MDITLEEIQHVHFVGIGGIGMSALAQYFLKNKKKVTGSDKVQTDLTRRLQKKGVRISIGHKASHIARRNQLVIYSRAVKAGNIELRTARRYKIPTYSYAQALGWLTQKKFTIAVAGTHGKSTTTAMLAVMMIRAGMDPTIIIGTKMRELGNTNFRLGKSNILLIEACEYQRSFLEYYPHVVVCTNVDLDHLDYFKDQKDYVSAFTALAKKIPHSGYLILRKEEPFYAELVRSLRGDFVDVSCGQTSFTVDRKRYSYPSLSIPGFHNKMDAALAFAAGKVLNIPEEISLPALSSFRGSWRRFERKGVFQGAVCFDDYGHHPVEIRATLKGAREAYPSKRIVCIFQPHQYSRTTAFLKEFGSAFRHADVVIIPNIYEARDESGKDVHITETLLKEIKKHHAHVFYGDGLANTAKILHRIITKKDIVITMGAGDVNLLYKWLTMQ